MNASLCGRFGAALAIYSLFVPLATAQGSMRPFTVADGIAMTRVNSGTARFDSSGSTGAFYASPDNTKVLAVIRRGDLTIGRTEYSLVMFLVPEVERFVNAKSSTRDAVPPGFDVLARFATSAPTYGIDRVKWRRDSRNVMFIGRGEDEVGNVFSLDVVTHELRQITRNTEDVLAFDITEDAGKLIYSAYEPPADWTKRNSRGYTLTSHIARDLTLTDSRNVAPRYIQQFILKLSTQETVVTALPRDIYPRSIWLSPGGRWAITRVQVSGYPAHWRNYAFIKRELESINRVRSPAVAALEDDDDDAFNAFPSFTISQFYLINVGTGTAKPLIDAPVHAVGFFTASWSIDEASVIVAPSYLGLDGLDPLEQTRRMQTAAVAEVEIATGNVTRVADVDGMALTAVVRSADGNVEVRQRSDTVGDAQIVRRYRRRGDQWIEHAKEQADVHDRSQANRPEIQLSVVQDLNSAPEISARDWRSGRHRTITDLNPQFRDLTFGRVEKFEWRDRLHRRHTGGLVYPPGFTAGELYPVVIQTYGFASDRFLLEGPPLASKAAFAAQALANRGILVLQMPDQSGAESVTGPYEDTGESPRFVAMLESAIDALDKRNLIDRDRVGLIGFSRSGMHVLSAIVFTCYPIAAATVADSIADTPMGYVGMFGYPSAAMTEWERPTQMGAPFWGEGIKLWLERSSIFHLDRIRTPLRLESYATGVDPRWDTYALLKRFRRPVEFMHIPNARHILTNPYHIYTSQQGNVDWYAFWLHGEEDSDPAKVQQYARWRELRAQHQAHLEDLAIGYAPMPMERCTQAQ